MGRGSNGLLAGMQGQAVVASLCGFSLQVELHVHMDGTCRLSTLQELSKKYNLDFPHDRPEEFKEVVCVPRPQPSLRDFLKPFLAVGKILR